jgi:hypothetical protein
MSDEDALIEEFLEQWGWPDPAQNEYFRSDLRELISKICPTTPSKRDPPFSDPRPIPGRRKIRI